MKRFVRLSETRHRYEDFIMADVDAVITSNSIKDRADSPVDLIRVATYINMMQEAIAMI